MYVVLDTSAVFSDLLFARPNSQVLLGHIGPASYRIALPSAVVLEHEKKLREQIEEELVRLTSAARNLDDRGVQVKFPAIDAKAEAKRVHGEVMDNLEKIGVEFPPTPTVGHDEFAQRSVNELKPWGKKSAGYRDALIWETVKEFAKNGPVLLVSQNPRDFCADGETAVLHPHLVEDLANAGINQDVAVIGSIADAVAKLVTPATQAHRRVSELLDTDPAFSATIKGDLEQVLYEAQIEQWDNVTVSESNIPVAHVDVALAAIEEFRLVTAFSLNDDDPESQIVLTFFVDAQVQFEFAVPAGAEPYLRVETGTSVAKVGGWALAESGWRPVTLTAQAKYDPQSGRISDWAKASMSDRDDV